MNTDRLIEFVKRAGYENKTFAEELGMAESTFYRKLKKKSFSVEEAQRISKLLKLDANEAYEIFFGRKLA